MMQSYSQRYESRAAGSKGRGGEGALASRRTAAFVSALGLLPSPPWDHALAIDAYTTQVMMTIFMLGGDYDAFAVNSNNRLVAEAIGIGLAILVALLLQSWTKQRRMDSLAQPEITEADLAPS
jgi:hypothetical protein